MLNRINKKITSLLFAALMITSVFAAFVTPVVATAAATGPAIGTNVTINATANISRIGLDPDFMIEFNTTNRTGLANITWNISIIPTIVPGVPHVPPSIVPDALNLTIIDGRAFFRANSTNISNLPPGSPIRPLPVNFTFRINGTGNAIFNVSVINIHNTSENATLTGFRFQLPPTSISVHPPAATLNIGENVTLNTTALLPLGAYPNVTWLVDNLTGTGMTHPINRTAANFTAITPGSVRVRAMGVNPIVATEWVNIIIRPAPTSINVTPSIATLNVGGIQLFTVVNITPPGADPRVNWSVDNLTGIGIIHANGSFRAVSPGPVLVTARSVANTSIIGSAIVTIRPEPTSINVTPSIATLNVTGNVTFSATVLPAGADQNVTWTVDSFGGNGTITATGLFTAHTPGPVRVTARSVANTSIIGHATVTVTPAPAPIAITVIPATATLNVTETMNFNVTVLPTGADSRVNWSVVNATVGTIDAATGLFTARVVGITNITATSVVAPTITANATVTVVVPVVVVPPAMERTPASISLILPQNISETRTIGIRNIGGGMLNWTKSDDVAWITGLPVSGISTGEWDNTNITINATGLAIGNHTGMITFAATGVANQTTPVTLTVRIPGDADGVGGVAIVDFTILVASFGRGAVELGFDPRADFNGDRIVNIADFTILSANFGR